MEYEHRKQNIPKHIITRYFGSLKDDKCNVHIIRKYYGMARQRVRRSPGGPEASRKCPRIQDQNQNRIKICLGLRRSKRDLRQYVRSTIP